MIDPGKTQTKLRAVGVPEPKARAMAQSVGKGVALGLTGVACIAGAIYGLVRYAAVTGSEPGLFIGLVFVLPLGLGVYFLFAGGNVASGQALDANADSPVLGKAIKLIRLWKGT